MASGSGLCAINSAAYKTRGRVINRLWVVDASSEVAGIGHQGSKEDFLIDDC